MKSNTYHVFFSKLSNPLRIKIITSLDKKPKSVSDLVSELKVEQSKLSHALKELKDCNIVNAKTEGKKRIYSLSRTIIPILRLIECHSKGCNNCKGCMTKIK
jgi:ArsR family transcriptional regulator, arsenate/arsenite/antimonite-responsive transcriptional repressor